MAGKLNIGSRTMRFGGNVEKYIGKRMQKEFFSYLDLPGLESVGSVE